MRRLAPTASASRGGKTTIGRGRAARLGVPIAGRDARIPSALRAFRRRRRLFPERLARFHVVRLRSREEVERWLATYG